ncbi:MAG: hypothetical protein EPN85_08750, partial [Bacteroidetes bacterium]
MNKKMNFINRFLEVPCWNFSLLAVAFIYIFPIILFAQNDKAKQKIEIKNSGSMPGQSPLQIQKEQVLPVPLAACSDLGAENGWSSWVGNEGYHQRGGSLTPTFFGPIAPPIAPRFNLTGGAGIDPCTQGTLGPPVPLVCPGFGNASIQLGQPNANGMDGGCANNPPYPGVGVGAAGNGCSEQLKYPLTVTAQDTNFIYAYALVLENPPSGHTASEAPFAEIYILDALGDTVNCSHRKYTADLAGGVGPGFFLASCTGSTPPGYPPNGMIVSYKPWTTEGINLSAYIGQNLTVVITNSDCARGGHYCYSYWDFSCESTANSVSYCVGNPVTITAPTNPAIAYNYQWYQNGNLYTGPPSGITQSITPIPQPGDTFVVQIKQPSGCNFWMSFVPQPTILTASTTTTPESCGNNNGTATANVTTGSSPYAYNWSPSGGNSSVATGLSAGNYSVIITDAAGCSSSNTVTVTASGNLTASTTATPASCGNNNGTATANVTTGNSPYTYNWSPSGGNSSAATGLSAGNYSVIITDASGCSNISAVTVAATGSVTATAGPPSSICPGTSASLSASGNGAYLWNNGSTASSITISPSVTTTYSVTVTNGSCLSVALATITVIPPPVAAFASGAPCAGTATSLTDGSLAVTGDPIASWNWSMPAGNPAAATSPNASTLYGAAGTHTVTLIITSQYGCKDTISQQVLVYSPPVANFSAPDSGCVPICVNYADLSTSTDGTVSSWQWSFPGAVTTISGSSTPQNICYNTPGNYGVSLIVTTTFGCKDSITLPMIE